jgi:DNA-binding NarL/FixJ family response regulator
MAIRIILADDHMLVREGLKAVIQRKSADMEVVGEAENGAEVLELAGRAPADVYILDISMPELNGIEITRRLKALDPSKKVIILSMHDSIHFVEKALRAGADGYILKQSSSRQLVDAIREVHAGGAYLSPRIARYVVEGLVSRQQPRAAEVLQPVAGLTNREQEILQLLAEGHDKKSIARLRNVSVNTVHVHINHIRQKLGLHSRVELVRFAIREGIAQA